MKTQTEAQLRKETRSLIVVFMVLLILSGITAFPLESELSFLAGQVQSGPDGLKEWITRVYEALKETNEKYPFMAYGTDWLAFAHIAIATAFIGPLKDPVKNIWVLQFGMISCLMVLPLAFICGPIRHIPFYWQLIDSSFGVIGIIPLYMAYKRILIMEELMKSKSPYGI